jgi:hypothetical protein
MFEITFHQHYQFSLKAFMLKSRDCVYERMLIPGERKKENQESGRCE